MKQQFSGDEQALIVRVLIADDSDIVLCALSTALKSLSEIEVVGLARDGLQALESAQKLLPDVAILDVQMPNMDGLEAAMRIKQVVQCVGILHISGSKGYMEASIASGGDGYLMKPVDREELPSKVRQIAANVRIRGGG